MVPVHRLAGIFGEDFRMHPCCKMTWLPNDEGHALYAPSHGYLDRTL